VRIYADIAAIQDRYSAERGVPRYSLEFALEMERLAPGLVNRWLLRASDPIPPTALDLLPTGRLAYADDRTLPRPDVIHSLAPFQHVATGLRTDMVFANRMRGPRTKYVATLYDLIPLIYADHYLRDPAYRSDYLFALDIVRASDLVLAISESTARDAVRLLHLPPSRVEVIGTGVPEDYASRRDARDAAAEVTRAFPALGDGYILSVGGLDFRKNMDRLLQGYARLPAEARARHPLALVCRLTADGRAELERRQDELGIRGSVVLTDAVSDELLASLYAASRLFVFPSLYEGFGIPVIEALRAGVPVVVGDNSSLRDLVPIDEARFDAEEPASIAAAIRRGLDDEELRSRIVREIDHGAHTWGAVADATIDAYARLRPAQASRVIHRPRIAFVTPLPPAPSGISDYSLRLLERLRERVDIDVFSQADPHVPEWEGVEFHAYGEFFALSEVRDYVDIVVAIGNSEFHVDAFEILRTAGGTVMLHDVRLTGLMSIVGESRADLLDAASLAAISETRHGRLPPALGHYSSYPLPDAIQTNGLMTAPVLAAADRVLVHSESARTIAALEARPEDRRKLATAPFGFPDPGRRDVPRDAVTSFGFVSAAKEASALCDAFIASAHRLPDVVFAFIGKVDQPALEAELRRRIADAGLADRVLLTGRATPEEYDAWLDRSILTVQPRTLFNGESSAAVAESIAAGVPTVVTRLGWMAELPDDVVAKLDRPLDGACLAERIVEWVSDPELLQHMSDHGMAFAAAHGFDVVADALLASSGVVRRS
jgi:glycosyltransferase involved in cell wall biosynthesis